MRIDTSTLSDSLIARLVDVLAEAEAAGCTAVLVSLDTSKGFNARIEWADRDPWTFEAHEFRYLVGHIHQHIRQERGLNLMMEATHRMGLYDDELKDIPALSFDLGNVKRSKG